MEIFSFVAGLGMGVGFKGLMNPLEDRFFLCLSEGHP